MKIESFKKLKDNKYEVNFDNKDSITLYDDVIVYYNLLVNKEMDKNKYLKIIKYNNQLEAYYLSLKFLNKKMRTEKEIKNMLEKKDYDIDVINKTIEKLTKDNYLDKDRYIDTYIKDQINLKDIGPNKIKVNLKELGFTEEFIDTYLENINKDIWDEKIDKYINKKMKCSTNLSAARLKEKIVDYLATKGFYKSQIMEILDNYEFITDKDVLIKEYNKIKRKLESKYQDNELEFRIKSKLYSKGFKNSEIEDIIKGE